MMTFLKAAFAIAAVLCVSLWGAPAFGQARVALVIGNADYEVVPRLANPANDATDLAAKLEELGFAVERSDNANFDTLRRALRDFAATAAGAKVALVYFAGHGIEIGGQNYLIPVDARLASDRDVSFEAVPLDLVIDAVSGARGLKVVMLDACRDNPFAARMEQTDGTRSIGRGLSRVEPASGTLVSYAAREGTTAADGDGRNSPYTAALIKHLSEPELEVSFLFRKVRDSVLAATNNAQEPFTYGSLPGRAFHLNTASAPAEPAPPAEAGGRSSEALDLAYWEEVKDSGSVELLEGYLTRFPDGVFADIAKARIAALGPAPPVTPPVEPEAPGEGENITLRVQQELARLGCEPGRPDGVWGARSSAALARYGAAAKLDPPPSEPSEWLLDRLVSETGEVCSPLQAAAPPGGEKPGGDAGEALPATRTYRNPTVAGLPVDICVAPFEGCKGEAATRFCQQQGFRVAENSAYQIFPETAHVTGGTCKPRGLVVCGGYTEITCSR